MTSSSPRARPGRSRGIRVWLARRDERGLRRVIRSIIDTSVAVLVSSEFDRRLLGDPRVRVLPNAYDRQGGPVGRTIVDGPPSYLFVGFFGYPPNIDAARWLVDEVWPLVRRLDGRATLRIVGRGLRAGALPEAAGVVLVGEVESMDDELRHADVALAPLAVASGTRVKILEAWAHGIPVVATDKGAEGLDRAEWA